VVRGGNWAEGRTSVGLRGEPDDGSSGLDELRRRGSCDTQAGAGGFLVGGSESDLADCTAASDGWRGHRQRHISSVGKGSG